MIRRLHAVVRLCLRNHTPDAPSDLLPFNYWAIATSAFYTQTMIVFGDNVWQLSNLAVFATNVQDDVSESQIRPKSQHSKMKTNRKSVPNVY